MTERRRFARIIHHAPAQLQQGQLHLDATIKDLSLHGLLLELANTEPLNSQYPVTVTFAFAESEQRLTLTADIVDAGPHTARLKISSIDINSISQLKRFIQLNIGNDELLHRELEHLSDLGCE
jgi:hypothetical protein